ncbi:MAG: DUF2924 domain-containing protein [Saccharofermentanales bacterium]
MKNNKHAIIQRQLKTVEAMDISALREKFLELYGFETTQTNMDNLRRRIMHRLQEFQFGGLTPEEEAILAERADNDPLAMLDRTTKRKYSETQGTKFIREWRGDTYEVIALGNKKFEFNGANYKSLTAIASKITGTHWNGRQFFGVNR